MSKPEGIFNLKRGFPFRGWRLAPRSVSCYQE